MGDFFVYSLKSSVCLAAFYLFYKLLLSRDTFHRFNRMALLTMMALSGAIPLIAFTFIPVQSLEIITETSLEHVDMLNPSLPVMTEIAPPNRLLSLILLIYLTGFGFCFVRSLWTLFRILRLIREGEQIRIDNNIRLTVHSDFRIAPFSWMKNIAISRIDMNEAGDTILLHEQAHIRLGHTFDLLLAELCILVQWYNPSAWLLYRELQHIHEFEADQSVLDQGIDAKQYQLLLIKKAVGTRLYSMANSLNHSNLKKRITMMLQKKSNSWARLKYAYVLPLAAISVIAFARPEISRTFDEISTAKVSNLILKVESPEVEIILPEAPPPTDNALSVMQTDEPMPQSDPKAADVLIINSSSAATPETALQRQQETKQRQQEAEQRQQEFEQRLQEVLLQMQQKTEQSQQEAEQRQKEVAQKVQELLLQRQQELEQRVQEVLIQRQQETEQRRQELEQRRQELEQMQQDIEQWLQEAVLRRLQEAMSE